MKKNISGITALSCLFASSAALSEPVYLDCLISTNSEADGKQALWHVTLDESTSSVSYRIPELNVIERTTAVFTADKVTFRSIEISRVDLSMIRRTEVLGVKFHADGQCKLVDAPPRKF